MTVVFNVNPFVFCSKPHSFNHSFILGISIAPFQIHHYSEALPITAFILCRS